MKMIMLLVMTLALALPAHSQESNQGTLTFNHIALYVSDLDQSAAFYSQSLNLNEIDRAARTRGVRWFSFGEGKELHLISPEYFNGAAIQTNKAVHLALTTNDLDGLLKRLDSLGITYGDWSGTPGAIQTRSDGVRQIFLQDPDGYWLEINSVAER